MTRDQFNTVTITDDFAAALAEAVEKAIEADVDVRGAWEFQTNGSAHAWDVVIDELVRELDDETE